MSGKVKLTVGEGGEFLFGTALYLNGSGITAAQRAQIIVTRGGQIGVWRLFRNDLNIDILQKRDSNR